MFKISFKLVVLMLLVLWLVNPVFAGPVDILEEGTRVGSFANQLDFRGAVAVSGETSSKTITIGGDVNVEVLSVTTDTVTAAESGKRFIYDNSAHMDTATTVTLPAAADGLVFHFTDGGMGGLNIDLDPEVGDRIVFLGLHAGDKLQSDTTGDTVTLIGQSGLWYIGEMGADAWADGGA